MSSAVLSKDSSRGDKLTKQLKLFAALVSKQTQQNLYDPESDTRTFYLASPHKPNARW